MGPAVPVGTFESDPTLVGVAGGSDDACDDTLTLNAPWEASSSARLSLDPQAGTVNPMKRRMPIITNRAGCSPSGP
jgi:hypothetical protein